LMTQSGHVKDGIAWRGGPRLRSIEGRDVLVIEAGWKALRSRQRNYDLRMCDRHCERERSGLMQFLFDLIEVSRKSINVYNSACINRLLHTHVSRAATLGRPRARARIAVP